MVSSSNGFHASLWLAQTISCLYALIAVVLLLAQQQCHHHMADGFVVVATPRVARDSEPADQQRKDRIATLAIIAELVKLPASITHLQLPITAVEAQLDNRTERGERERQLATHLGCWHSGEQTSNPTLGAAWQMETNTRRVIMPRRSGLLLDATTDPLQQEERYIRSKLCNRFIITEPSEGRPASFRPRQPVIPLTLTCGLRAWNLTTLMMDDSSPGSTPIGVHSTLCDNVIVRVRVNFSPIPEAATVEEIQEDFTHLQVYIRVLHAETFFPHIIEIPYKALLRLLQFDVENELRKEALGGGVPIEQQSWPHLFIHQIPFIISEVPFDDNIKTTMLQLHEMLAQLEKPRAALQFDTPPAMHGQELLDKMSEIFKWIREKPIIGGYRGIVIPDTITTMLTQPELAQAASEVIKEAGDLFPNPLFS